MRNIITPRRLSQALSLLLFALATSPAAAAAPTLSGLFQTVCGAHQGDLAGAETAARALGYLDAPRIPEVMAVIYKPTVLLTKGETSIMLGQAPDSLWADQTGGTFTLCGVVGDDPSLAASKAIRRWVGVRASGSEDSETTFVYRAAKRRGALPEAGGPAVKAAIAAGQFRVLDINIQAPLTTIALVSGRPR